jgi:sugar lactone lactonase YvrE
LRRNGIQLVDNFVPQTKISVQNINSCFGISWVEDNVYVSGADGNGKGRINILDSNGRHISSISSVGTVYYIHHSGNNIYYTDYDRHMYCIKKDGSNVFTFRSPDLKEADGIDNDRQGNVYVVGRRSNNIVRLSPDGQNSDIIMKEEDGISDPVTLCFSKDVKKLFVSNEGGKRVVVYHCEY